MSSGLPRIGFACWRATGPSGGNRYDAELIAGLRGRGVETVEASVRSALDDAGGLRAELDAVWGRADRWLVDGIVAVADPALVSVAREGGRRVAVIVHHFPGDAPGLTAAERGRLELRERTALRAADVVVCPSRWASHQLARRHGIDDAVVARPGVAPAEVAPGSRSTGPPQLLSLGALTPVKDQLTFVRALERIRDLTWTARIVGGTGVDPAYAAIVRRAVHDAGLAEWVELPGASSGPELDALWQASDLLVHPSRSETYGLVVTEALARGIPALVSAGTGLAEALQAGRIDGEPLAGAVVASGRPGHLAAALRGWLVDDELATSWRSAAGRQRERLPGWSATVDAVLTALDRLT